MSEHREASAEGQAGAIRKSVVVLSGHPTHQSTSTCCQGGSAQLWPVSWLPTVGTRHCWSRDGRCIMSAPERYVLERVPEDGMPQPIGSFRKLSQVIGVIQSLFVASAARNYQDFAEGFAAGQSHATALFKKALQDFVDPHAQPRVPSPHIDGAGAASNSPAPGQQHTLRENC